MTGTVNQLGIQDAVLAMFAVRYTYYSCLTFLSWEWLINLSSEMKYIWNMKSTKRLNKFFYAWPRYLGLITSICNCILVTQIQAKRNINLDSCLWWYGFQKVTASLLLFSLEAMLMLRIYALYGRKRSMGIFLSALLIFKAGMVAVLGLITLRKVRSGSACLIRRVPRTAVFSSALEVLVQSIIWGLTFHKHLEMHSQHGWQNIPLLSLVTRDGSWAFILLTIIYVVSLKDAVGAFVELSEINLRLLDIAFPILIAVISFVSCRLILNMNKFGQPISSDEYEDTYESSLTYGVQLTTLRTTVATESQWQSEPDGTQHDDVV